MYSVVSGEKGKTHTILTCISASGVVLPPMMIYPRKKKVPDKVREGCVPNTLFVHSDTGWINADLFLEWFKFFIKSIPPTRPVLLIQDGHSSHVSIELVELARENNIYIYCVYHLTLLTFCNLSTSVVSKQTFPKAVIRTFWKDLDK